MPFPTSKPFFTALAMLTMFCGLLIYRLEMPSLALTVIIGGALLMVSGLYSWLTSPLE